jgi:hypothetical protein
VGSLGLAGNVLGLLLVGLTWVFMEVESKWGSLGLMVAASLLAGGAGGKDRVLL